MEKETNFSNFSEKQINGQIVKRYGRQQFLNAVNIAYAKLRTDKQAWRAYQEEILEWDVSLSDGLKGLR